MLHTLHCTMYKVHYTVYNAYTIQCILPTLYSVHCLHYTVTWENIGSTGNEIYMYVFDKWASTFYVCEYAHMRVFVYIYICDVCMWGVLFLYVNANITVLCYYVITHRWLFTRNALVYHRRSQVKVKLSQDHVKVVSRSCQWQKLISQREG